MSKMKQVEKNYLKYASIFNFNGDKRDKLLD